MTLCGHVLLTETHLSKCTMKVCQIKLFYIFLYFLYLTVPRSSLATVSDILVYVLQFILNEISSYSDDEANFNEFNPIYFRKLCEISNLPVDSEEFYRYILKVNKYFLLFQTIM